MFLMGKKGQQALGTLFWREKCWGEEAFLFFGDL